VFTPSWSGSGVVSFEYLVHGQGGGTGEGAVRGRSFEFERCGPSGRGKRESDSDAERPSLVSPSSGYLPGLSDWVSWSQTWGAGWGSGGGAVVDMVVAKVQFVS